MAHRVGSMARARWLAACVSVVATTLLGWAMLAGPAAAAGPAASITLQLSSPTVQADGTSTVTATASAFDSTAAPLPGDTITLTSNDPGEIIGPTPMTDNGDGTYSATVQASTTAGSFTLTASDGTVSGQASLTQTAGPAAHISVQVAPTSIMADGSSTSAATATVTDANHNAVHGETVMLGSSDAGELIAPTTMTDNGDGTYSSTVTSSTAAGPVTITATDGGLTPATATLTQTGPPSNVSVSAPGSLVVGASATVTATVTDQLHQPIPGNVVSFSSPAGQFGPVTDNNDGTYSATYTASAPGQVTITAADGVSGQATLDQVYTTATTLSTTPQTPETNQPVTVIVIVTSNSASGPGPAPAGTITVDNNGAPVGGCTSQPGPVFLESTCQITFSATTSPEHLSAFFATSSPNFAASSGADTVGVGPSGTSTSVDVSNPSVNVGSSATFTAHVTPPPANLGPAAPSGSVGFLDGTKPVAGCSSRQVTASNGSSVASCTVTYTVPAHHYIRAIYSGDRNFSGSASSPVQVVNVHALPPVVLGTIRALMQWTFNFGPRYTTISQFSLSGVPIHASVAIVCHGVGCPFKSRIDAVRHSHKPSPLNLLTSFKHRHLRVGTWIVIKITRSHWVGKYYRFTMRKSRAPSIQIGCLAPGGTAPNVGC